MTAFLTFASLRSNFSSSKVKCPSEANVWISLPGDCGCTNSSGTNFRDNASNTPHASKSPGAASPAESTLRAKDALYLMVVVIKMSD